METAYSFPPLAAGSTRTSTMWVPTATTGLLPSIRSARTSRGTSASVPAMSAGTTAAVTTGSPCVQSQNKVGPGESQPDSGRRIAARIKPSNHGRSPVFRVSGPGGVLALDMSAANGEFEGAQPLQLPLGAAAKQQGIRGLVPSPANARSPAVRLSFACGQGDNYRTIFEDFEAVYIFGKQALRPHSFLLP